MKNLAKAKEAKYTPKKRHFSKKIPNFFWVKNNKMLLKEINGTYVIETCEEKKTHEEKERLKIYTTSSFNYLPSSPHKMMDPPNHSKP
jgi:hypothetical protein